MDVLETRNTIEQREQDADTEDPVGEVKSNAAGNRGPDRRQLSSEEQGDKLVGEQEEGKRKNQRRREGPARKLVFLFPAGRRRWTVPGGSFQGRGRGELER